MRNGTGQGENERKKYISFLSVPCQSGIQNSKKNSKNIHIIKDINMTSFKDKTGRDRLKMREEKNIRSDLFKSDPKQGIPKKQQKNYYDFFSGQNETREAEDERKKKLLVRSIQTRPGIGNSRKIAKKFRKIKNINMASFKAKTRRDRLRMRGKKNYHSDPFKPDSEQGIPKKQQKN